MKQIPSDKYSIAWFKLAECVTRGEREKALGVYKLLYHSIEDQAFAAQLEGDLLESFQDPQAAIKYEQAAQLYKKQNRLHEAVGVYEHMVTRDVEQLQALYQLTILYLQLQLSEKAHARSLEFFNYARMNKSMQHVEPCLELLPISYPESELINHYQHYLFGWIEQGGAAHTLLLSYLHKILDILVQKSNQQLFSEFMGSLKIVSGTYYEIAQDYLSDK